ncbi:MAG: SDR family oxidoreductase [Rhodospirillales bacterium]|nr:SDR family oxidoreductase [Rhodospirillales bacterium]
MRLEDKVAVVTGAARGIGAAVASAFAAEGARVALADVDADRGRATAAALEGASFVACDVGDTAQARGLVAEAVARHGRLDVCVNNAGIMRPADVLEITEEDFDVVLRVNLKGAFLISQAAAKQMVKQGGGSIVNISSIAATVTTPELVPYSVSKGGLNQLTRSMAVALAARGVRVNAIGPGSISTDMLKIVMSDDVLRRQVLSRTPMGRLGEPDDIARVAVFLASDESAYVTGQCLYADGGRLALTPWCLSRAPDGALARPSLDGEE